MSQGQEAHDWDAARYHVVSQPHVQWGDAVLQRLRLRGDETVLDAGCGTGRVTAALLERLPRGQVVAVDQSPAMLAEARQTLARWGDRVQYVQASLLDLASAVPGQVDHVLSTATFHWIDDHQRLFDEVFHVLRPGGWLVAQCGGGANIQRFIEHGNATAARQPFAPYLADLRVWHHRASAQDTQRRLAAAGFSSVRAWLEPSPQRFDSRETFAAFIQAVVLGKHLALLPDDLRSAFVDAVVRDVEADADGVGFVLDYVRLNMEAQRPRF